MFGMCPLDTQNVGMNEPKIVRFMSKLNENHIPQTVG